MMPENEKTRKLLYSLEKAHRDTVGFGYEEREHAQDDYLRSALEDFSINVTERDIASRALLTLALLYSVSCMHDDAYARLMRTPAFSRSDLMNELVCQLTTSTKMSLAIMYRCVTELTQFEIKRVARKHATSAITMNADAHEAKNFRFVIELDAVLRHKNFERFTPALSQSTPVASASCEFGTAPGATRTETDNTSGIEFRKVMHIEQHWENFQTRLATSSMTPAVLMTATLMAFAEAEKNSKPLLAWHQALRNYCNCFVPEANKVLMRLVLQKVQEWCAEKNIETPPLRDVTGSGMAHYSSIVGTIDYDDDPVHATTASV